MYSLYSCDMSLATPATYRGIRHELGELGVEQLGTALKLDISVEDDELVKRQDQVVEWRHVE